MEEIKVLLKDISETDSEILINNAYSDSLSLELDLLTDSYEQIYEGSDTASSEGGVSPSTNLDLGINDIDDGKTNNIKIELVPHYEDDSDDELEETTQYPFIELVGVTTMQELEFLASNQEKTDVSINLQIRFGEIMKPLGFINFDLKTMRALHFIGGYTLILHKDEYTNSEINLDDPDTFVKLVRL